MEKPLIIGLIGHLNSGKNVVGTLCADTYDFSEIAFADSLKSLAADLFDIDHDELWGPSEKRTPRTREILQVLGTDVCRKYDPEIWVRFLCNDLDAPQYMDVNRWVVTDVRFPNEAQALKQRYSAVLIKIVRPGALDHVSHEIQTHASETSIDEIPENLIDYTIVNDGTLEELKTKALAILRPLCSH